MSFLSPVRHAMHGIDKVVDNSKWLRILSTALGGEVWRTGLRQADDKPIGDWKTADWTRLADSISAYRQYRAQQTNQRQAGEVNEAGVEQANLTGQDATIAAIRRAYGVDTESPAGDLSNYLSGIEQQLARPSYEVYGAKRTALEQNRNRLAGLLSQVRTDEQAAPAAQARAAIDSLSARQASGAKRDATRELDTRLAQTLAQNTARAYVGGNGGSSIDKAAKAGAISDYERGRVGIGNALSQSDSDYRTALDQQRTALEDKARSGALKSFDPTSALTDEQNAASTAYANLSDRALGKLLATSADLGVNGVVQNRAGNAGFAGLSGYGYGPLTQTRSTSGTISRG